MSVEVVDKVHEAVRGEGEPIKDTDWLADVEEVAQIARALFPASNLADLLLQLLMWLETVGRADLASRYESYLFENRVPLASENKSL